MRVLHVPFTYHPEPCGGTEVYVASLCSALMQLGTSAVIAAPSHTEAQYEHDGLKVRRFATNPELTQDMMYGKGDPLAARNFAKLLDEEKPDLVHFHAFSPAVSGLCLAESRKRGIPCVSTYHTPTQSCQRGTLLRWGSVPCNGNMLPALCAACFLQSHGMPRGIAQMTALISYATQPLARIHGLSNAARAVLRAAPLMTSRHEATRNWWKGMANVIALCEWTRRLLLLNGVPSDDVRVVRHGLPYSVADAVTKQKFPESPLRLAFLGRLDATKGIDLLIEALRTAPDLPVTLDLFTIVPIELSASQKSLIEKAKQDVRIRFRQAVPACEVVAALRDYHALLVPSRWFETGPLVVLEAFAAGIPVVGSDLGGIQEWVTHGLNGLLVSKPSAVAWSAVLRRLILEPDLLPCLRAGVQPPRSMRDVANEMLPIYQGAINSSRG